MEIGEPKRIITIEPLEEPAPSKAPPPERPIEPDREPVREPAPSRNEAAGSGLSRDEEGAGGPRPHNEAAVAA